MQWDFIPRRDCPVCGCAQRTILINRNLSDPPVSLYLNDFYAGRAGGWGTEARNRLARCRDCKNLYEVDVLSDAQLPLFYERVVSGSLAERSAQRTMHAVQRDVYFCAITRRSADSGGVLDFGAGWGHFLDTAQDQGLETIAIEFNGTQRRHLAQRHAVTELDDVEANSIGLIRADRVFEHVSQPTELLRALANKLTPSGVIAISVPPDLVPQKFLSGIRRVTKEDWRAPKGSRWSMNFVAPLEHLQGYSERGLRRLGRAAGLREWHPSLKAVLRNAPNLKVVLEHLLRRGGVRSGTIFLER